MTTRSAVVLTVVAVCFGSLALAQPTEPPDPPLVNWSAPPYWSPTPAEQARQHLMAATGTADNHGVSTQSLPSSPLPFVAVSPCRLYDSRANSPFTGDSTFTTDGQTEQFNFYATSTTPYAANGNPNGCTLPTAGTVGAWSLKFTYRTSSATQGYLTAFPSTLSSVPGIGTILGSSDRFTSGAAIVPAGTDADNTIKVYAQYAANTIVIDYNGYFTPAGAGGTWLTGGVIGEDSFGGYMGIGVTGFSSTESAVSAPSPMTGTIDKFMASITNSNCGGSHTFTLRVNGANTALTCSGNYGCSDTTDSVSVNVGDLISVYTPSSGSCVGDVWWRARLK